MPFDQHKNLAISRVIAPPSPATLGTAVDIVPGHEVRFPAPPFNVTIWPPSAIPDPVNAEVARVTLIQANRFFIERTQEGTTARAIQIGDFIAETITAKAFFDIESGTNFPLITTPGPITSGDSVTAPVGNFGSLGSTPITAHATQHEVGGSDPIDGALALTTLTASGTVTAFGATIGDGGLHLPSYGHLTQAGGYFRPGYRTLAGWGAGDLLGLIVTVTDSNTTVQGAVITGGGATDVLARWDGTNWRVVSGLSSIPALHAPTHSQGGTDPVDVKALTGYPGGTTSFLRADKTFATPTGIVPSAHAATHKAGGSDLLQVTTLPGYPGGTGTFLRADATFAALPVGQQPGLHAPTHAIGGSDPVVKTFRTGHTWGLVGDLSALAWLPSMFVHLVGAQTARIVGLHGRIMSGTSITFIIYRNGVALGSGVVVTTTPTFTQFTQALSDGDEINVLLSAPSGTPTLLSATLVLEHTV